jgi:glycosyltransferase involved in cell wall biosynthesis
MKILHIVGDSKFGGGAHIIIGLCSMAKQAGHDVSVLTTDRIMQQVLSEKGIRSVSVDVIRREISPLRDLKGLFRLYKMLREGGYALVHTHTSKGGVVGRLAARMAGVPIVVHTVHGFAFHEESPTGELVVYSLIERLAARWCDALVTVSEFHRDWALRLGIGCPTKVLAIPNGISEQRLASSCASDTLRARLKIQSNALFILALGRLAPQKGLEDLLCAVPMMTARLGRPVKTVLVGDGPLLEKLEKIVCDCHLGESVVFAGFHADVGSFLSACDVVALPSLREGLSIALLEAMAAEKPIVTTRIGSNLEATRNGEAAVLIPPHDPGALAEAIIGLVNDPIRARVLSQKARAIFLENYTERRMLDGYKALYDDLAKRHICPGLTGSQLNLLSKGL